MQTKLDADWFFIKYLLKACLDRSLIFLQSFSAFLVLVNFLIVIILDQLVKSVNRIKRVLIRKKVGKNRYLRHHQNPVAANFEKVRPD